MYISFYLDNIFYSGEAEPRELDNEMVFDVDLGWEMKFTISMGDDGEWISNRVTNLDIVRVVGQEIERRDNEFQADPQKPLKYISLDNEPLSPQ